MLSKFNKFPVIVLVVTISVVVFLIINLKGQTVLAQENNMALLLNKLQQRVAEDSTFTYMLQFKVPMEGSGASWLSGFYGINITQTGEDYGNAFVDELGNDYICLGNRGDDGKLYRVCLNYSIIGAISYIE